MKIPGHAGVDHSLWHCLMRGIAQAVATGLVLVLSSPVIASSHEGNGPLLPLPSRANVSTGPEVRDLIVLGGQLFRDRHLSGDGRYACIDCHDPRQGGSNGRRIGRPGSFHNVPSIFNLQYRTRFYRNGRAFGLEEQARMAIENPEEMASDWNHVLRYLETAPAYRESWSRLGIRDIEEATITSALAAYERTLSTPESPFDRYLRGDEDALDEVQKKGYEIFLSAGCQACHQGRNLGANLYQKIGIINTYEEDDAQAAEPAFQEKDRKAITGRSEDKGRFLVPSLRNITRTAPYLHDGSIERLEDVVRLMFEYQLGREINTQELGSLLTFLTALEGDVPTDESVPNRR